MLGADSESPLHMAADASQPAVVALLLQHGAVPTAQDRFGSTPLHRALAIAVPSEASRAVVVFASCTHPFKLTLTPLHC